MAKKSKENGDSLAKGNKKLQLTAEEQAISAHLEK